MCKNEILFLKKYIFSFFFVSINYFSNSIQKQHGTVQCLFP